MASVLSARVVGQDREERHVLVVRGRHRLLRGRHTANHNRRDCQVNELERDQLRGRCAHTGRAAEAHSSARLAILDAQFCGVLRPGRHIGGRHVVGRLERAKRQLHVRSQHLETSLPPKRTYNNTIYAMKYFIFGSLFSSYK